MRYQLSEFPISTLIIYYYFQLVKSKYPLTIQYQCGRICKAKHGVTLTRDLRNARLEDLLDLYRQSEPKAFTEFFNRTSTFVFSYLRFKLRSHSEAEDVMQDTYFRIHRYIASYDSQKNAMNWIMTIARNAMFDHLKSHRELSVTEALEEIQLASKECSPEQMLEFRRTIETLCLKISDAEYQLLLERVLNDSSYSEIALERNISVENARQKVSRILKRLRSGNQA